MKLPDYCQYAGPTLTLDPPFPFTNVTVATFPLRANLDTLQRFIDSYLNIVPPEVASFRVSMPYVFLMLLDYGKLANTSSNFGSFSQREMLFFIPLEQYKRVGGRWVFQDWASVTPFIYVDGQISLTLGRTAMGWPKSIVSITPDLSGWLQDPDGLTTDISISAEVFPETYKGAEMQELPIVVVRSAMSSSLRIPFDPESPMAPWNVWARLGQRLTGMTQDYLTMLGAGGVLPQNATSSPENFARKLERAMTSASQSFPWAPNVSFNSINLKQFRRADDPSVPCYQALTYGPMRYTSFQRGGLLGDQLWDASGGYVVDLACFPTFPIVDALGLEVATFEIGKGPKIARATPVTPFWYLVNMEYERTQTLAFRGEDGTWLDGEGQRIERQPKKQTYYFNTTIGAATPVITGPFHFDAAAIRVLSLSGSLERLQAYIDQFLNEPMESLDSNERFEVWCGRRADEPRSQAEAGIPTARVYMALVDWGDVTSESNSLGDWADTTLTFYIPIKRIRGSEVVGIGLFPAYTYASGTIHTCTLTELYGVPTTEATFVEARGNPKDLERRGEFTVLELSVESVPALHEGQMVRTMRLLELVDTGEQRASHIEPTRGEAGFFGTGISVYTLKQFRDVAQPGKACYQALVKIPHQVRVTEVLEVPRTATLRFNLLPMHPICSKLGLLGPSGAMVEPGAVEHSVKVEQWILMEAEVFMDNGVQLCSRVSTKWEQSERLHAASAASRAAEPAVDEGPDAFMRSSIARFPSQPPAAWKTL